MLPQPQFATKHDNDHYSGGNWHLTSGGAVDQLNNNDEQNDPYNIDLDPVADEAHIAAVIRAVEGVADQMGVEFTMDQMMGAIQVLSYIL